MHLPTALYSREGLVVLKLNGPFNISLPLSFHLPRLETLSLGSIYFEGEDTLKIVTSGFPALKELVIHFCTGLKKLSVDCVTLNRFKIRSVMEMMIAVKGPNVRILDLDYFGAGYEIIDLNSLVEARIDGFDIDDTNGDGPGYLPLAVELLKRLSHVQTLRLEQPAVNLFGRVSENELPMFPNLTLLEIAISHSMFQMLLYAPRLTHLIVDVSRAIDDHRPFPSNLVPHCLLSLPTIEIQNFGGYENSTALIEYIFKNALVLKELKIHMHRVSVKRERDAFKKLLGFPRLTPCSVIICSSCGDKAKAP